MLTKLAVSYSASGTSESCDQRSRVAHRDVATLWKQRTALESAFDLRWKTDPMSWRFLEFSRGPHQRCLKVAVIFDNPSKLIDNEFTVWPFILKFLSSLSKISESVADPEARSAVVKAIATLRQVGKIPESEDGSNLPPCKATDLTALAASITVLYKKAGANPVPEAAHPAIQYAARLAGAFVPYFELVPASPEPASIACELLLRSAKQADGDDNADEEDGEGKDLYNCQFSLANGAKILLNSANLRLRRGHRHDLCGCNRSGKSTLLRAIPNGLHADTSVLPFILQDKHGLCDQKKVFETIELLRFNDERQGHTIGSLSGGWNLKLASARTMLFKANILLLDEPTNLLDVVTLPGSRTILLPLETCTSIFVSPGSGFLNNSVTDILHLDRFKI
ncbi:translational elongation factor EF-1 alpha [Ceratobasidium sp. UAMH 11750]|nr:translational elongation factor EF-1 alpha [Ceratobasidium sp. UAMH 11750]